MDVTPNQIVALAREMAMAIKPPDRILETLEITPEQFKEIEALPIYQSTYKMLVLEWESVTSTKQRLAIQAQTAIEDVLPEVAKRAKNAGEALPGVVSAVQWLAKVAGITEEAKSSSAHGEKFKIIINLGADKIEHQVQTVVSEVEAGPVTVPALPPPAHEDRPDLSLWPEGKSKG